MMCRCLKFEENFQQEREDDPTMIEQQTVMWNLVGPTQQRQKPSDVKIQARSVHWWKNGMDKKFIMKQKGVRQSFTKKGRCIQP